MKSILLIGIVCVIFSGSAVLAGDPPPGFEDPVLLDKVMKGEFVNQDIVHTKKELHTVSKSFFNRVSTEAFIGLITTHEKYPDLADDIQEGKTLSVNSAKTEFTYELTIPVKIGPFTTNIRPQGLQIIQLGAGTQSESRISNKITNYTDMIQTATESTRLFPYQGGLLVEDTIHVIMKKEQAGATTKIHDVYDKILHNARAALQGDY